MTSVVAIGMAPVSAFLPATASAAGAGEDPAIDVGATVSVGSIPGEFSVDRFGQGSYAIPLEIPPNRGNLIPPLQLANSNEGGLGQYGVGWSVTGISAITECHQAEGSWGWCLDGMPLVASPTECIAVGETGDCVETPEWVEVFRTYPDSGARITHAGTRWFVESPDGRTTTLTGGTHSDAVASRISDRFGNYIEIAARHDPRVGLVVERIDYTGNLHTEEEPTDSIIFTNSSIQMSGKFYWLEQNPYNPCPADEADAGEGHRGDACEIQTPGTDDGTGLDLLSSVALCAGKAPEVGVPSQGCLPPTRFEYFREPNELRPSGIHDTSIPADPCHGPLFGDFDGDSLTDAVWGSGSCGDDRLWLWSRQAPDTLSQLAHVPEDAQLAAQDLDGDGSIDLLFFDEDGEIQTISQIQSDGSGWSQWTDSSYAGTSGINQFVLADVNADGLGDLVACEGPDEDSLELNVYAGRLDAVGHNLELVAERPRCGFGPMEVIQDFGQDLVLAAHGVWREETAEVAGHYVPALVHPEGGEPAISGWSVFDWESTTADSWRRLHRRFSLGDGISWRLTIPTLSRHPSGFFGLDPLEVEIAPTSYKKPWDHGFIDPGSYALVPEPFAAAVVWGGIPAPQYYPWPDDLTDDDEDGVAEVATELQGALLFDWDGDGRDEFLRGVSDVRAYQFSSDGELSPEKSVSTGLSIESVSAGSGHSRDLFPVVIQDDPDPDLEIWIELAEGPDQGDIQVFDRPGIRGRPMTLVHVEDGVGAVVDIDYREARIPNDTFVTNTDCPTSASQAIYGERITRCAGSGGFFVKAVNEDYAENGRHARIYEYRDGRYDAATGRFLGFDRVIEKVDRGNEGLGDSSLVHITGYEPVPDDIAPTLPSGDSTPLAANLPYLVDYELTLVLDDVTGANGASDTASLVDNTWDRAPSGSRLYLRRQTEAVYEMASGDTLVQAFRADDPSIDVVSGISPAYQTDRYIDIIDEHGNVRNSRVTADGVTTWTARDYVPRIQPPLTKSAEPGGTGVEHEVARAAWLPSRLQSETVTYDDGESVSTEYAYYDENYFPVECTQLADSDKACAETAGAGYLAEAGVLRSVTIDPGTDTWRTKELAYDAYGNIVATTSESADSDKVQNHAEFDADRHLFPVDAHNALGQRGQVVWNTELGVPTLSTVSAGRQQSITYDGLGRRLSAQSFAYDGTANANLATSEYQRVEPLNYDGDGLPTPSAIRVRSSQTSGPWLERTYGPGNLPTLERWLVAPGQVAQRVFAYGIWGELESVTIPHFEGEAAPIWSVLNDSSGRVLETIDPSGDRTRNEYSRRQHSSFDAEHPTPWRYTFDAFGRIESVVDPATTRFCYSYDVRSNLDIVTKDCDFATGTGVETADFDYDVRGRMVRFEDPASGVVTYDYDALGRLSSFVNGAADVTELDYDALGRLVRRSDAEGEVTYHFDSLGVLEPPSGYTGTAEPGALLASFSTASNTESWYAYDEHGQIQQTVDVIDGEELSHEYSYDEYRRLRRTTYPTVAASSTLLELEYEYDNAGNVSSVLDAERGPELWRAAEHDASGRVVRFDVGPDLTELNYDYEGQLASKVTVRGFQTLLSQSYAYTPNGNVDSRQNNLSGVTESFEYDTLNRLTHSSLSGETWTYDKFGNMIAGTGIETNVSGQIVDGSGVDVTYDDAGRLREFDDGDRTLSISWNSDGQPSIIEGSEPCCGVMSPQSAGDEAVELFYGPGGELVRRRAEYSGDDFVTRDSIYAGNYELADDVDDALGGPGDRVERVRVPLPGGSTVVVAAPETPNGKATYLFTHPDLLGSAEVVTKQSVSDSGETGWPETSGLDGRSYGPWGEPRAFDWGSTTPTFTEVNEGFTGHRAQRDGGMIDMNLRHYDPATQRFISPDPVVGNVYDTQAWNRYAYVRNNPTSFTDPTGALWEGLVDHGEGTGGGLSPLPEGVGGGYGQPPLTGEDVKRFLKKLWALVSPPSETAEQPQPPPIIEKPSPFGELEPSFFKQSSAPTVAETITFADVEARGIAAVEAVMGPGALGSGDRWRVTRRFQLPRVPDFRPWGFTVPMSVDPAHHTNGAIAIVEGALNLPADTEDYEVQKQRALERLQNGDLLGAGDRALTGAGHGLSAASTIVTIVPIVGTVGRLASRLARARLLGRGLRGPKQLLPALKFGNKQFGKKVGKHAEDFGLDASNPAHRTAVRDRIESIVGRYDEVRQGPWNPQGGGGSDFLFYRQGSDIVVTKPSGDFVTVLPGGTTNGWFSRATSLL